MSRLRDSESFSTCLNEFFAILVSFIFRLAYGSLGLIPGQVTPMTSKIVLAASHQTVGTSGRCQVYVLFVLYVHLHNAHSSWVFGMRRRLKMTYTFALSTSPIDGALSTCPIDGALSTCPIDGALSTCPIDGGFRPVVLGCRFCVMIIIKQVIDTDYKKIHYNAKTRIMSSKSMKVGHSEESDCVPLSDTLDEKIAKDNLILRQ